MNNDDDDEDKEEIQIQQKKIKRFQSKWFLFFSNPNPNSNIIFECSDFRQDIGLLLKRKTINSNCICITTTQTKQLQWSCR